MSLGGEERARDTLISSRNLFQSHRQPLPALALPHRSDRPPEPPAQRPVHSDTWVKNGGARGLGMSLGGEERARDTLISSRNLFQSHTHSPFQLLVSPTGPTVHRGAACSETRPQ